MHSEAVKSDTTPPTHLKSKCHNPPRGAQSFPLTAQLWSPQYPGVCEIAGSSHQCLMLPSVRMMTTHQNRTLGDHSHGMCGAWALRLHKWTVTWTFYPNQGNGEPIISVFLKLGSTGVSQQIQDFFLHGKGYEDYWTVRNIVNSFQQEKATFFRMFLEKWGANFHVPTLQVRISPNSPLIFL